jgi:hypothetical protein|tara:strand:- start:5683 stop:6492 length:810 start_codon:yes stop_codon:yes gene_type:complete
MGDILLTEEQVHTLLGKKESKILKESSKKQLLKEYKWYNTFLDVVGIVDPTGAADAINAISYFRQGHIFFGFLSLVSLIPYAGDAVAKPIIALTKMGKGGFKGMDVALKSKNASKVASEATKMGDKGTSFVKWLGSTSVGKWLMNFGKKIGNFGVFGIKPFSKVGSDISSYSKVFKDAGAMLSAGKSVRVFRNLKKSGELKGLLGRTKLYSKMVNWMVGGGVVAATIENMSDGELDAQFSEFIMTDEGKEAFNDLSEESQQEIFNAATE